MDTQFDLLTIVRSSVAYSKYPLFALTKELVNCFEEAAARIGPRAVSRIARLVRVFDCFLGLIGIKRFGKTEIANRSRLIFVVERFVGALFSEKFISLTPENRYLHLSCLRSLLLEMRLELNIPIRDHALRSKDAFETSTSKDLDMRLSTVGNMRTPFVLKCIDAFEEITAFDTEVLYLCRAWPAPALDGRFTWLQLYPIYKRIGKAFTERLHQQCIIFMMGRRLDRLLCIDELAEFIAQYPAPLSESDFLSSDFTTRFWREFLIYYITTGDDAGVSLTVMTNRWRHQFVYFVEECLVKNGIFAESYGPIPSPPPVSLSDGRTNIKKTKDGTELHAKLLVHIPLHITDSEAMNLVFHQLQHNVDLLLQWARAQSADIWSKRNRRVQLAMLGTSRELPVSSNVPNGGGWLIAPENPDRLQNLCATFEKHGHLTSEETTLHLLYSRPLPDVARELGLPTTSAFLPHCTILVATHPAITPAFLEGLELYDKNGNDSCLVYTDQGPVLRGLKKRRGAALSWQEIFLTAETEELVKQIIELTAPLRDYLKNRNDPEWRYLFLGCEQGFAYPRRVRTFVDDTSLPPRIDSTARSIHRVTKEDLGLCLDLANSFSLVSLRATAGVLIYLETKDVNKMAEALGHRRYEKDLIARYLPDEILSFFQERWIRIFQATIVIDAMKDSDYLLQASGFKDIAELNHFLDNHMTKKLPRIGADSGNLREEITNSSTSAEVLFGIDISVLIALVSLEISVKNSTKVVNETASYWYKISTHLTSYIDSDECSRDDLKAYLQEARRRARPDPMTEIIRG